MGNCLKTQLKESVNNTTLPRIGEICFDSLKKTGSSEKTLTLYFSGETKIRVSNGGGFALSQAELETNPLTEHTFQSADNNYTLYFKDDNYKIFMSGKYVGGILRFLTGESNDFRIDISEFKYWPTILDFDLYGQSITGNIDVFSGYSGIRNLNISGSSIIGDLATLPRTIRNLSLSYTSYSFDISGIQGMPNLETFNSAASNVTGDINSLSSLTSLQILRINQCPNIVGNIANLGNLKNCHLIVAYVTGLYGEINDYEAALRSAGGSGTYKVDFGATSVTYNGIPVSGEITITI